MNRSGSGAVFLSYASQDAEAAKRICEALRAGGVEVWFDQSELRGGDAWDQKIRRQIKECTLFVPVISANTQTRVEGYFRLEWKLAVDRSHLMADDAAFILPAVIDDTTESSARVPDRFLERQWTRIGDTPELLVERVRSLLGTNVDRPPRPSPPVAAPRRSVTRLFVALVGVAAAGGFALWYHQRATAYRWAREFALPEIARLAQKGDAAGAFELATRAETIIPNDPALAELWPGIAVTAQLTTTLDGVEVQVKPYRTPAAEWQRLGVTPLKPIRLATGFYRWQFRKDGQTLAERAAPVAPKMEIIIPAKGSVPEGMVQVTGRGRLNLIGLEHLVTVDTPTFYIDKYETTNREFKQFIAAGGYTNPAFWKETFFEQGRELARAEAMARFVDRSGQPGPAGWTNGTFPDGEGDRPVTGVSWYEAAAYAEFARKRLPTIYHWSRAASGNFVEHIVPLSNFSNRELAPVGTYQGMSACGAFDMAGNAKEWCSTAADANARYLLGGGCRDPEYQFTAADAQSGFERGPVHGFRCMQAAPDTVLSPELDATVVPAVRDYSLEKPVNDEVFRAYQGFYSYDKSPLDAREERQDDSDRRWIRTKVSFNAAYGNERVAAHLFRPRNFPPPFQTIVYFPGSNALAQRSSENLERSDLIAYLVNSGRLVVFPIYKGTYERHDPAVTSSIPNDTNAYRDRVIQWSNDLGRTLDYLETRRDVQMDKLAYYGASWGARLGIILIAVEPRIKLAVLASGGLRPLRPQPQVDDFNFAPRVRIPVLLVNGRYDFTFPVEGSQLPLYRTLGSPPEHKAHRVFDYPHVVPAHVTGKEAVQWLDQYFGAVK